MTDKGFRIVILPHLAEAVSDNVEELAIVQRYRQFRLYGLQSDPDAFASSYAEESMHSPASAFWRARLHNPQVTHCVAISALDEETKHGHPPDVLISKWLGLVAMIGPQEEAVGNNISAKTSPLTQTPTDGHTQRSNTSRVLPYHFGFTFTAPCSRRCGISAALVDAALEIAEAECRKRNGKELKHTVHVDSANAGARRLYERAGFKVVGEETYTPRPRESGVQAERVAALMEYRTTI